MSDTYKNTVPERNGAKMEREPSYSRHSLKYAQDFDKGSDALNHTAYMKKQRMEEMRDDKIVMRQKKHY